MKKLFILLTIIAAFTACDNQENLFPDNEYLNPDGSPTGKHYGVYFGEQYPVRTLVLGHERFENPDNDSVFHIGVSIGGMYTNNRDWKVDYILDKTLADSVIMGGTDTVRFLPDNYYSIEPAGSVIIPSGSFDGLIKIKLNKNFFELLAFYRVEHAKKLIREDKHAKLTVEELAELVGYNSKSSFNTAFKKNSSKTPSEYRKSLSGQ